MSWYDYAKSFLYEEKNENIWTSILILFVDEGKVKLDEGFILNDVFSSNYYSFFCNFKNFTVINNELYYKYSDCIKKIDPKKVYLHIYIGKSKNSLSTNKIDSWNLYFSSLNNKLYKEIKEELTLEKINIIKRRINEKDKIGKIEKKIKTPKITEIENPLFLEKQNYNENSVFFSNINIDFL